MSDPDKEYLTNLKKEHPEWFENVNVLELGSRNLNGSVREYFTGKFTGVDWVKGKDVDVVCYSHETKFDKMFDVLISYSTFEHDSYWKESIANNMQYLKKGGVIMFSWGGKGSIPHGVDYATDIDEFKGLSNETLYVKMLKEEVKYGKHYFPKTLEEMLGYIKQFNVEVVNTHTRSGGVGKFHYLTAIKK